MYIKYNTRNSGCQHLLYRPLSRFPKFLIARDYACFCLAKTSLWRTRSAEHYGFNYRHTDQTNTPYAMRAGIRILNKLRPMGHSALLKISTVGTVPEIFVRSRLRSFLPRKNFASTNRQRFALPVQLSPYRPNKYPARSACRVFVWSARWDSNPLPSESESDTLSK